MRSVSSHHSLTLRYVLMLPSHTNGNVTNGMCNHPQARVICPQDFVYTVQLSSDQHVAEVILLQAP